MRVLLVSHRFPPDRVAGVELYTEALAAGLAAAGDTVSVVARRPRSERRWRLPIPAAAPPRLIREQRANGTTVYRFAGGDVSFERFLLHHRSLEELFSKVLREAGPDVVHVNHLIDLSPRFIQMAHRQGAAVVLSLLDLYFACPLAHLQKRCGQLCFGPDGGRECARTCFSPEGNAAKRRWPTRDAYFRRLLTSPERVIAPSAYIASFFESFGSGPGSIRVVPIGVWREPRQEIRFPEPLQRPKQGATLRLAFLGAVAPFKGVHVMLDALRLAGLPSVELLLVGMVADWPYARALRKRAARIPGVRLRMTGWFQSAELPYFLESVDCAVIPSQLPESFSITAREALAHGIPLIVSRLGGLAEAVTEGTNGLTFAHDRPDELATVLQRLAMDESLLRELKQGASRTRVLTMREHVDAVRMIHQEALADRGRRRSGDSPADGQLDALFSDLLQLGFANRPPSLVGRLYNPRP